MISIVVVIITITIVITNTDTVTVVITAAIIGSWTLSHKMPQELFRANGRPSSGLRSAASSPGEEGALPAGSYHVPFLGGTLL